ncbi:epididymal-specific lipocalin-9 [Peromyscus eremicus]|uniref:epididymal-specific lipocalin-9 n=1 Tax=Peromyscus eremicus TaxID=42410 RepID=UPI0027DDDBDF|nr:epididymal-specific lipocalin-9 [Peromyscus eremicus]
MVVLLVLGLVLSLAAAQFDWETISRKNYNMAKISGIWYSIFMASDNMTRIEEKGDLRVFMRNINPLRNGSLKFDFFFMVHGECVAVTMVCEKTENDGEFTVAYEGENRVLLTETDYRMYITFYMQNIKNGTKTHVLALYGRLPVLNSSYLKRFVNICKKYRLNSQNIIDLTNKDFIISFSFASLLVAQAPPRPPRPPGQGPHFMAHSAEGAAGSSLSPALSE